MSSESESGERGLVAGVLLVGGFVIFSNSVYKEGGEKRPRRYLFNVAALKIPNRW